MSRHHPEISPEERKMDDSLRRLGARMADDSSSGTSAFVESLRDRLRRESASRPARVVDLAEVPRRNRTWRPWMVAAATAAAGLVVLAFIWNGGWRPWPQGPLAVIVHGRTANGVGFGEIGRDTPLVAGPDESLMLALDGGRALVAVQAGARVTIGKRGAFSLEEGTVWCEVVPGSGRFEVDTAFGRVEVVGTEFGVSSDATSTRVDVASGKVRVVGRDGSKLLERGQSATFGAVGSEFLPGGTSTRPKWVESLRLATYGKAAASRYPSGQLAAPRQPGVQ